MNKYNQFFNLWRDFTMLLAFISAIGLFINIFLWESTFDPAFRDPNSADVTKRQELTHLFEYLSMFLFISTLVAIVVCGLKHYCRQVWEEYKNSLVFYKTMVQRQAQLGLMDPESLGANFNVQQKGFRTVMKDWHFWAEVLILLLIPYPFTMPNSPIQPYFSMTTINFAGVKPGDLFHGEIYSITYMTTDILTCMCFLRVYFIALAIFVILPFNVLQGKKICLTNGVQPGFGLQLKAALKLYPYFTFALLAFFSIFMDAYIIRVWERPYYQLVFDPSYYDFRGITSSIWYTVISMTSVGYGNIVASTHVGRACAVYTIINGAVLIALLIGLIISWFELEDVKK
jgi:hypothetical protein